MKFKNRNISTFGSYGFTWDPLEPEACTGTVVSCHLEISSPDSPMLQTKASLLRERTRYGDTMGLRFYFEKIEYQILEKLIKKHGFYPTEYLRKYPRIPSTQNIGVYPLRVIAKQDIEETLLDLSPMVLDIRNISINGILISTENPQAHTLRIGQSLDLMIEPRGSFHSPIHLTGQICRIIDEIDKDNSNLIRHFGIKYTQINPENRTEYSELLRKILTQMKG